MLPNDRTVSEVRADAPATASAHAAPRFLPRSRRRWSWALVRLSQRRPLWSVGGEICRRRPRSAPSSAAVTDCMAPSVLPLQRSAELPGALGFDGETVIGASAVLAQTNGVSLSRSTAAHGGVGTVMACV